MKEKLTKLTQWLKDHGVGLLCLIGMLIAFIEIYLLLLKV